MRPSIALLVLGLLVQLLGCGEEQPKPQSVAEVPAGPQVSSKLTVLVVADRGISAGLQLLRGEWAERSGGELEIVEAETAEFLAADELTADLVIYPSRYVGELVHREWIRPVRNSVLESEDVELEDFFPLLRDKVLRYGDQAYALSLGEPPLMLQWPRSSEDQSKPNWREIPNPGSAESSQLEYPLAIAMLARSVAYSQSRSGLLECFDSATMQAKLTEPPFVRALSEMIASSQVLASAQVDTRLGWPHARSDESAPFDLLPLAANVYRPLAGTWEANELSRPLTFFPLIGRSVSVSRSTRNSASAFKLFRWLVSENIANQLSPRSDATIWFRRSQTKQASKWISGQETNAVAAAVVNALSAEEAFLLPRIPGIDEYLEVLDAAARTAVKENQPAEQVLTTVAEQWDAISERLGVQQQRTAYLRHLGLEGSAD